jgi:hypothetical protein
VGKPDGSTPNVSIFGVNASFVVATVASNAIGNTVASGLGTSIAVANSSTTDPGDFIATQPTLAGTPPGRLLAATVQALLDGALVLVREVLPADVGTIGGGTRFGTRVAPAADIDGDGRRDFIVGTPGLVVNGAARTAVFVSSSTSSVVGATIAMPAGSTSAGTDVIDLGDIDGDGLDDYAFGAPDDGARGRVFLLQSTSPSLRTIEPTAIVAANARFGAAVTPVQDVDGDGLNELLIGAPLDTLTAVDVPGCDAFSPRAYSGDCAGGVYLVPSSRLTTGTPLPCFFRNSQRAGRLGAHLRGLGRSLVVELAADHQRFVVGEPGLGVDDDATVSDDSLGKAVVVTFKYDAAANNGAGGCLVAANELSLNTPGALFGDALPHG